MNKCLIAAERAINIIEGIVEGLIHHVKGKGIPATNLQ